MLEQDHSGLANETAGLVRAEREAIWDIAQDLIQSELLGNSAARARLARRERHTLRDGVNINGSWVYAGWESLDILGRNDRLRLLFQVQGRSIRWVVTDTHSRRR
jgi:hypothetical protein